MKATSSTMRVTIYVFIILVLTFSIDLTRAESKKNKKYDIDNGSEEKLLKQYRNKRATQADDGYDKKYKCKGKQCNDYNTDKKYKNKKKQYFEDRDNNNLDRVYKINNENGKNPKKDTRKDRKGLQGSQRDNSLEDIGYKRKTEKKTNIYSDPTNYKKDDPMRRKSSNTRETKDEDTSTQSKINRRAKRHDNNNGDEFGKLEKFNKDNTRNMNTYRDYDRTGFSKQELKVKKKSAQKSLSSDTAGENTNELTDLNNAKDDTTEEIDDNSDSIDNDVDNLDENNYSDEIEDTNSQDSCNKKSGCKDCSCAPREGEIDPKKKVRYSIKFAHEKQKYVAEADSVSRKINGLEKKRNKFGDDDSDEDSSEEDIHPKRLHFIDEDEDY